MTAQASDLDLAAVGLLLDEAAIKQLSVNYALATDALGRGEYETGRELYRRTFTPDAQIRAASSPEVAGPDAWAEFVARALANTSATQHLIGTIDVRFDESGSGRPDAASMTTYLCASHERSPGGDINVVLGTYVDRAVRLEAGWRIAQRTLIYVSTEQRKHG